LARAAQKGALDRIIFQHVVGRDQLFSERLAKSPDVRNTLTPILPQWISEPITLCALFSSPSRLTPKVQALLDFLDEDIGTDRDPRLKSDPGKGYFTDRTLAPTSGT